MKSIFHFKYCIIVFVTLIISCTKDSETQEIHYQYLAATLKPYMFKNGSYWVYENDSTGILDSIHVTNTTHGFFSQPPMSPGTPSNIEIEYYRIDMLNNR